MAERREDVSTAWSRVGKGTPQKESGWPLGATPGREELVFTARRSHPEASVSRRGRRQNQCRSHATGETPRWPFRTGLLSLSERRTLHVPQRRVSFCNEFAPRLAASGCLMTNQPG